MKIDALGTYLSHAAPLWAVQIDVGRVQGGGNGRRVFQRV